MSIAMKATVMKARPSDRSVFLAWRPPPGMPSATWKAAADAAAALGYFARKGAPREVAAGVAGIHDGADLALGGGDVLKAGDWFISLHLSETAWTRYLAGELTASDALATALGGTHRKKGKSTMKTKPTAGAVAKAATRVLKAVINPFDTELRAAKAAYDADPSARNRALLQEAGRRSLGMKMVAQEHARAGDIETLRRTQFGLGNPLFKSTNPTAFTVANDPDVDGR